MILRVAFFKFFIQKLSRNNLRSKAKQVILREYYTTIITIHSFFQQQQRPDLARLMQMHAQAQAGQLAPGGPAGLPPGLLAGHPGAPTGLPTTMSLLAGIPTSAAPSLAGPHPAFASLLAAQKPTPDPLAMVKGIEMDLKRSAADTNGGEYE